MTPHRLLPLACVLALVACSSDPAQKTMEQAEYHYKLGSGYYFDQNIPMAIQELDTALGLAPEHPQAHFLMAFISMGRKQYNDAVLHLKRAIAAKPDFLDARINLGAAYLAMRRWDDAITALEPLLSERLYTTPFILHNNLGFAWQHKGDLGRAGEHYRQAIFLNPRFCLGMYNLGEVLAAQGDERGAAKQYKRAVEKCPGYVEPYFRLGALYEKRGRYAEALDFYKRCMQAGGEGTLAERCRVRVEGDVL